MRLLLPTTYLFKNIFRFAGSSQKGLIVTLEVGLGIILFCASLLLFLSFTDEMLEADFTDFDIWFSHLIYGLRMSNLTSFMLFITFIGSKFSIALVSLISIVFLVKRHKKEAVLFSLSLIIGTILNAALKILIQRPRPELSPLIAERSFSFPSGHAMNSFIFFALAAYFSYHFFKSKRFTIIFTIFSALCVLLIGFSRIYLGVHYLTDVVAGYIAGFWWFITVLLIDRTFIFYKLFRKSE